MIGYNSDSVVRVIAFFFLRFLLTEATGPTCYDVTGNANANLTACDPSSLPSACCPGDFVCLSNGLCLGRPGGLTDYTNFGCTEPGGSTGGCTAFGECGGSVGITGCGDNSYCCYGSLGCDCNNATQTFTLPPGTTATTIPLGMIVPAATSSTTASTSTSTASTTPPGSSITSVATPAQSSPTAQATVTIVTTPTTSPTPSSQSSNTLALGVGAGFGIGIILFLAAALGFWCLRRRRKSKALSAAHHVAPTLEEPKDPPVYAKNYGSTSAAPSVGLTELDAQRARWELDAAQKTPRFRAELPSR